MRSAFPTKSLGDLATKIDYGVTASASPIDSGTKFLRITDIQDGSVDWLTVPFCEAPQSKLQSARLDDGDIVFARTGATTGKSCLIKSPPAGAVFASYLIRVRPSQAIDASYLAHFFKSSGYWGQIKRKTQGAAQGGVNASSLSELQILLPPIDEQRRIAAILDKVDALRRKRKRSIELLEGLTQSVFLEMFGDPVGNPLSLHARPLSDVASFVSGGTPSKAVQEFWDGDIPWVSPKDMKVLSIVDAEDHVSGRALAKTSLKYIEPMAVLIVVRGMILAHTAPIAIARRAITINQDIKAILFGDEIDPEFGFWCLKAQERYILSKVSSAAHGTKRLEMADIESLNILVPSISKQRRFVEVARAISRQIDHFASFLRASDILFSSLQRRSFAGELA